MAAVEPPLQPDFEVLSNSVDTALGQLRLLPNIPAIQGNNRILGILEGLQQQLDRMEQRINSMDQSLGQRIDNVDRRIDNVDRRIDNMDQRISSNHEDLKSYVDTRDRNAQARLHNSQVSREPRLQLMALWSLTENDTIPNFPEDLAAIERLEEVDLNNLLQHLGRVPRGPIRRTLPDLPDRKSKLAAFKREIGITVKYSSEVGMI